MTAPKKFKAGLKEEVLKEDATSGQTKEQLPIYNCFSADGDVTAALVYVNYGLPDDYEYLKQVGIDVKGKIVIARYGKSWRGIKPKVAQEIGRAHVCNPVTNAHLVCRPLLEKKEKTQYKH